MDILPNMTSSGDTLTQGHQTTTPITARSSGTAPVLNKERTQYMVQQVMQGHNEGAADRWLNQREKRHRERAEKLRESLKQKLILEKQMQLLAGKSLDINNNNLLDFTALPSKKSFGSSDVVGLGFREKNLMDSLGKLSGEVDTDDRKLSGLRPPSPYMLPPLQETRKISEPSFVYSTSAQQKQKKSCLQSRDSLLSLKREQSILNIQKRQSQSLETIPAAATPWASNTTIPPADRALPVKKLYPDNVGGTSNRKYAINFCHLADAPFSFANHYLQERNKEQLDHRTICSFWLQHLEHYEQIFQINESLSLKSPDEEEIYDETWDEL